MARHWNLIAIALVLLALALLGGCRAQARAEGQPPGPAPATRPAAPPGDDLLFMVADDGRPQGDVYLWSVATGQFRQIPFGYTASGFSFASDGARAVFLGAPRSGDPLSLDLFVLDLASTEVRRVTTGFWGSRTPTCRPGTDEVAVPREHNRFAHANQPGDDGLWLVSLRDGRVSPLGGGSSSEYPCCVLPRFSDDGEMLACQREGRYTAVMDVTAPTQWFRLDRPEGATDHYLMDLAWGRGDHTLWLACTAADRYLMPPDVPGVTRGKGPGGIWRWRVAKSGPTVAAPSGEDEPMPPAPARGGASADLVFEEGHSVYAVALSHDGQRLAYLTDDGIWIGDIRSGTRSQLAATAALPELKDVGRAQDEDESGLVPVNLAWSATDRYLSVLTDWGPHPVLRVIAIGSHAILDAPRQSRSGIWIGAAWRPAPRTLP